MTTFTDSEVAYLTSQRLGRLATVAADGYPQNNPVGFPVDIELGTIEIGGHQLGRSRKVANVRAHPQASFVVDDLTSVDPWWVRGVEIRGDAEVVMDADPLVPGFSRERIRIRPRRIRSWGLDPRESFFVSKARTIA